MNLTTPNLQRKRLIIAEDDDDDVTLLLDTLRRYDPSIEMHHVRNGEELLDYLGEENLGSLANTVILLDLNMPRKDGREALRAIRSDQRLRNLPVVVLSTSRREEDVNAAYSLGVNSFVTKPMTDGEFTRTVRTIDDYWFKTALLPE